MLQQPQPQRSAQLRHQKQRLLRHLKHLQYRGAALVELVLVILLVGIIFAGASELLTQGFRAYFVANATTNAEWQERVALERMVRDLRAVRSSADIVIASSTQFSFVSISGNSVNYQKTGTQLMRNSQTIASGVQSVNFSYYDENGESTAQLNAIRYITMTLTVTSGVAGLTTTISASATVYPWNLTT